MAYPVKIKFFNSIRPLHVFTRYKWQEKTKKLRSSTCSHEVFEHGPKFIRSRVNVLFKGP